MSHRLNGGRRTLLEGNKALERALNGVACLPKGQEACMVPGVIVPKKSPWLNPIEPMWIHSKCKAVEPDRKLSADELANRICAVFE
jgi:hypothetical protein